MRLIDADVVKQNILEVIKKQGGTSKDLIPVRELPLFIDIQPTAYSVDKVVEDIDKKYNNSLWIKGDEEFSITRNELIEIVKHGGVSDDVCECRLLKGYNFLVKTSCCDVFEMENGYKFCPYCGKKIKIVGE